MGVSPWSILVILLIVVLLFGTKKLRNVGGDLGSALKGFKKALNDDDSNAEKNAADKDKNDADFETVEDKSNDDKTVKPVAKTTADTKTNSKE